MFPKDVLKTKTVSVWGLGYLGYTTILRLQNNGFNVVAYDPDKRRMEQFIKGKYPDKKQADSWSHMGYLPKPDLSKVKITNSPAGLFKNSLLHFIAIPESPKTSTTKNTAGQIAEIFSRKLKNSKNAPLIVFESVFIPGHIERYFVEKLKKDGLSCSKNYYLGALFRTDWSVETFINQDGKIPIAGYCQDSLKMTKELFDYLNVDTIEVGSLKDGEIYVNSINAIQAMASDFVRQLTLGYPSVNMKRLSNLLFKNVTLKDCVLNVGTGGERMTFSIDYLIEGSDSPDSLTLLKEYQDINITSVLSYAEYIIRHGYKSVAIMGVTYRGNQKDLTLSPSVTLAEYFTRNEVKVFLDDPLCTKVELQKLIKGTSMVKSLDDAFSAEVIMLASDHNQYKYLSQSTLDGIKKNTKLIIDNYGIWSHLKFGKKTRYYQTGDGSLNLLK